MPQKMSFFERVTAYSTNKKVRVVDWRLGVIHVVAISAIVVYVVLFELFYKSKAFTAVTPVSTVRMSLQQPVLPGCTDVMNPDPSCDNTLDSKLVLPYCLEAPEDVGQHWKFPRFNCTFMDAIGAVDMQADKSISVATRITQYFQNRTCWPGSNVCPKIWSSLPVGDGKSIRDTHFVVGPENFTLLVDANSYGSTDTESSVSWSLEATSLNTTGKMLVSSSQLGDELCNQSNARGLEPTKARFGVYPDDKAVTSPCYINPMKALDGSNYDTFILRDVLSATGLDLSHSTGFNDHSTRYEGTIVIIKLVYANIRQWGIPQQKAVYTYEIDWLEESKFKVVETVSQNATSRVVQDRHGLWIVVTVNGSFMYFDVQNFIVQLSSFFSLLAIATFMVDFMMIYVVPERTEYKAQKYDQAVSKHERCSCFKTKPVGNKEPLSNSHDGYSDDEESVTTYHRMPPKGSPAGRSINQADDDTL